MSHASAMARERFTVLDGMRGVAALVVITDHVQSATLMALLPGRYLAVDFFFALSGFVLAHVYGERLASGMPLRDFMRVRLIRLYPLYLFATLAGALLLFASLAKGWVDASATQVAGTLLFGLALLPTPPSLAVFGAPFALNGPAWSLFFELLVNIFYALTAPRLTWRVLTGLLVVSGALLAAAAFWFGRLDVGFLWSNLAGGFPRVAFAFFAGIVVYRLRGAWRAPALPAWACVLAMLAIFMVPAAGSLRPAFDLLAAMVLFPLLIAFAANARSAGRMLSIYAGMGLISYGIYVLQTPVRDWTYLLLDKFAPGADIAGAARVAIVAAATIAAAALLHMVYDLPVRRFLTRLKPAAPIAPAPSTTPTQS
ncbi:MAG: acyltransferase [Terricaulis sp.]